MSARASTTTLLFTCLLSALSSPAASAGKPVRPNILWITAEDIGPHLGCYGDAYARTPALDAFARQSVRYTRAFATAPVCSPARSCLITGLYATSLGTQRLRSQFPVPRQVKGFPAYLRAAGYYCSNNEKTDYNLRDEAAFIRQAWNESSPRAHWRNRRANQPFFAVFNLMVSHQTRASVWSWEQFRAGVQSKLTPAERHDPAHAPLPPYYPDTPEARRTVARYYDCLTAMDQEVARRLRELEADGLADETIVFFFGDNGMGLPRGKRCLFDTGVHEPLLIRFPKAFSQFAPVAAGEATDRLVSFVDFAPSILSLAGVAVPAHLQGIAFLGPAAGQPREFVFGARDRVDEAFDLSRSVRDARFLYIRNFMPHLSWMQPERFSDASTFRRELKDLAARGALNAAQLSYAAPRKALEELYDTEADPDQIRNVTAAPEHQGALRRMRQALRGWIVSTRDVGFLTEPQVWERLERGSTPFDLARDEERYPLPRLLAAADLVGRPQAVEAQLRMLDDLDDGVRYWAAVGLRADRAPSAAAQAASRRALRDRSPVVRIEAAAALAAATGEAPALEELRAMLRHRQPEIVLHAARALELLGEIARPVLPTMREVLNSEMADEKRSDIRMFVKFSLSAAVEQLARTVASAAVPVGPRLATASEPRQVSGIYPHLAMFNNEGECGTGAVVPWADRLWVVTYGPHFPFGSSDKLYEITPDLRQIIRPESVGGTPANRMIHRESNQLLIGPYLIDAQRKLRVIPPARMPGRLTGNARHLTDPSNKVYYATMEEGLYEVDVRTLEVTGRIKDGNPARPGRSAEPHPAQLSSQLAGYHGKGFYSGQGRVVYANNGEHGARALSDPTTPSGALAEWRGQGDWQLVRRNQFTDVTGPGGLYGSARPESDPIWSIGWDARSLILMLLDHGQWHAYRLPKASHCYDGAHGWNTEWPRIRDVGETDLLMTMHGMFWKFPRTFSLTNSAGLAPRSTYLKVIGDFCRWGNRLALGCDDTAKSEFLNKRKAKGSIVGPGQSQSNLRFIQPEQLDQFGPALGRGAVWLDDTVKAGEASDPFLFAGFERRGLHLAHAAGESIAFALEIDRRGDGHWRPWLTLEVPAQGYRFVDFAPDDTPWIRLRAGRDCRRVTAFFHYFNRERRTPRAAPMFDALAKPDTTNVSGGLLYARGANLRTLRFVAQRPGEELGCYDLDANLRLARTNDPSGAEWVKTNLAIPQDVLTVDAASVLFVDDQGRRWRLPRGEAAFDRPGALGNERVDREVCTERDLFNCHGTFYELPAENAGGFAKIRPIATHNRRIKDYASYRGLLVLSGVADEAPDNDPHVIRSDDGRCALWLGAVDDLWHLGKPRGQGGPWKNSRVQAGVPSDPYLMTGYDRKTLTLSHAAAESVGFRLEVDFTGTGHWAQYRDVAVAAGETYTHEFPESFGAYWVRLVANRETLATAQFTYD